jgi:Zn ribbon nucleic-acid-binding protein
MARVGNRRSRNANLNTTITGLDTVNWWHDNDDRLVEICHCGPTSRVEALAGS